jgi:hypothetical protein
MGSTGNPGGEPSLAPRGPVTPSPKRGAGRKGAPATHDICPARHDLYHAQYQSLFRLAVLLPGKRRRRGGGGAGLLCRVAPPAESARRRRATPCRTCGDRWWPGHGWPGITSSGTAAGGPWWGAGPPAATALRTRHLGP